MKEEYFGTKYQKYLKPDMQMLCSLFKDNEWQAAVSMFKIPAKNRFIPDVPDGI